MGDQVSVTSPGGAVQKVAIVPDGYFLLQVGQSRYRHFVELDRGTETAAAAQWGRKDWTRKVPGYLAYLHSGAFGDRYKARSFRVLTVTTSPARLATLKRVTEEAGGKTIFWFGTLSQLSPATMLTEAIWQVASTPDLHALVE